MKLAIGDVIQVPTSRGFAYAQYTHSHPVFGAVIRVFEGIFSDDGEVPDSNTHAVRFTCLFPLKAAVSRGIVKVALRGQVREELRAFPTFRAGVVDPASGKVKVWWLWDGKDEIRVGEIDVSQRRLPIRGVWNDTLLIARIEQDWTPETDLT